MSHLRFSTIFDLSGNTFWPQASGFQKLSKLAFFGIYNELLSTQNINVARFARNVVWDIFCDFQTLCFIMESWGEKGAISIDGNIVTEVSVKKNLNIVDLTGAGDLFACGYLHGYLNNFSRNECLNKGTEMSSKIIQQIGARL